MLAEERPITQDTGNQTSCSHLVKRRCSGVARQGVLTPSATDYIAGIRIEAVPHLRVDGLTETAVKKGTS